MNNSPFKFLDSYTKADKEIFFGREKETEEKGLLIFLFSTYFQFR